VAKHAAHPGRIVPRDWIFEGVFAAWRAETPDRIAGGVCVVKAEWGLKRICPNCGTRYYDFRKDPPTCPACGTVYDPEALLKSRRARPGMAEEPRKGAKAASRGFDEIAPADVEEDVDLVPDAEDDDDGAGLIEDPGELGEDTIEEVEVEVGEDEE
jgi:uncharacterized protein (TIGR02300 family)